MSTRDNMRRELKELAKLAETMGKESPADAMAVQGHDSITFPAANLERPVTPASSSRVSVGPFATSTAPPVFEIPEPNKRWGSRTGFVAVVVGASLAAALVGGAFVGKSLAGGSATAAPITAAAAVAPQMPVAPPAEVAPVPPPAAAPQDLAGPTASPIGASTGDSPAAAATVHKHMAKPAPVPKAPISTAVAATPANASSAISIPKPAAAPALAKPKAAGGSSDSLEDLIRKEVAAQKK